MRISESAHARNRMQNIPQRSITETRAEYHSYLSYGNQWRILAPQQLRGSKSVASPSCLFRIVAARSEDVGTARGALVTQKSADRVPLYAATSCQKDTNEYNSPSILKWYRNSPAPSAVRITSPK